MIDELVCSDNGQLFIRKEGILSYFAGPDTFVDALRFVDTFLSFFSG